MSSGVAVLSNVISLRPVLISLKTSFSPAYIIIACAEHQRSYDDFNNIYFNSKLQFIKEVVFSSLIRKYYYQHIINSQIVNQNKIQQKLCYQKYSLYWTQEKE
ncbi:Hypothetical_protein [Hexamita inflata]|uniref:Hypothetical_protein n=1 Tax=Hexamita inflata TaxID=28002 RepID=A0AA86TTQ5_9EUKA|nr:Hypothetical protein HINF_LOCUS15991 [Hexamita inflata]